MKLVKVTRTPSDVVNLDYTEEPLRVGGAVYLSRHIRIERAVREVHQRDLPRRMAGGRARCTFTSQQVKRLIRIVLYEFMYGMGNRGFTKPNCHVNKL